MKEMKRAMSIGGQYHSGKVEVKWQVRRVGNLIFESTADRSGNRVPRPSPWR